MRSRALSSQWLAIGAYRWELVRATFDVAGAQSEARVHVALAPSRWDSYVRYSAQIIPGIPAGLTQPAEKVAKERRLGRVLSL